MISLRIPCITELAGYPLWGHSLACVSPPWLYFSTCLYACQQCLILNHEEVVTLPVPRDQGGLSLHHEPWGLNEHLTWWNSLLLQTHISLPDCCSTNDQSHTALIKKSLLGLGGSKGGFLPAVPRFLVIARRSYSSNNFPYMVLVGMALEHLHGADCWRWSFSPHCCPQLAQHLNFNIYYFSVF